ncbi:MAG: site-specific DNA-methyltransferase [Ignavibacteria bacterium]|nr:site-specific DNA-methyltransferase [Ignavibacteria bacterium]
MDGKSLDIEQTQLEKLKAAFPEAVTEGKIDWEKMRMTLGEDAVMEGERYVLNWAGKSEAFKAIQTPTTATLKPQRDQSINFDATQNVFIEGENLEVLKVLQKSYYGKVKMIYIDPPYNTGNDSFIYPDKFSESKEEYLKRIGDKDEEGYLTKEGFFKRNSKENGQFHSNWLSMMYPRLFLARNLLRDDGVIFMSIDDNEVHNLRLMMNEIFGEENFVAQLVWEKGRKNDAKLFSVGHEYIIVYSKIKDSKTIWREEKPGAKEILAEYRRLKVIYGEDYNSIQKEIRHFYESLPKGHLSLKHRRYNRIDRNGIWRDDNISWPGGNGPTYDVIHPTTKQPCRVPERGWAFAALEKFKLYEEHGFIEYRADHKEPPILKRYLNFVPTDFDPDAHRAYFENGEGTEEVNVQVMPSVFYKNSQPTVKQLRELMGGDYFDNPKDSEIISRLISYVTEKNEVVLDFFAGSGTTAQAMLELNKQQDGNRKFILVQLPEKTDEGSEAYKADYRTIADICKERIRRVSNKIKKDIEAQPDMFKEKPQDVGFKVLTLEASNFKVWRTDTIESEEDLKRQMEAFEDPVRACSIFENMAWEILLKLGYELTTKLEKIDLGSIPVYSIADGEVLLVLEKIKQVATDAIAKRKPKRVICLDRLFEGKDQLKTNTALQMKDAGVEFVAI